MHNAYEYGLSYRVFAAVIKHLQSGPSSNPRSKERKRKSETHENTKRKVMKR